MTPRTAASRHLLSRKVGERIRGREWVTISFPTNRDWDKAVVAIEAEAADDAISDAANEAIRQYRAEAEFREQEKQRIFNVPEHMREPARPADAALLPDGHLAHTYVWDRFPTPRGPVGKCRCGVEFDGGWKGYAFHLENDVLLMSGAAQPTPAAQGDQDGGA
jgi:hypothetical protein